MSEASTPSGTGNSGTIAEAANAFAEILDGPEADTQENDEAQASTAETDEVEEVQDESEEVEAEEAEADDDEAEPESEEEQEAEDEATPVYTVKVDGQEIEVPLDELLKGYSRTQDYTRKTQQIAEVRKAAEAELQQVRVEREQYSQLLGVLQQQVQQAQPQQQIDWERLRNEDPIEFAAQWADHQRRSQQLQALQAEQQRLTQIQQQERAVQMRAALEQEVGRLVEAIPEWRDEQKAAAEKAAIKAYGQKLGFTTEELAEIYDHRAVLALRKAYLYDQLMSRKGTVKPTVKAAAPTLKPGTPAKAPNKVSDLTRAKQKLAKTGSVRDAAAAFETLLGS